MPHIANTPESILPRCDSKNPATTCRSITAQGRPCRRPLAMASLGVSRPAEKLFELLELTEASEPQYGRSLLLAAQGASRGIHGATWERCPLRHRQNR